MREEFMITRQGKQFVLFAGLLDEAHSKGLCGIETELVEKPWENDGGVAVVHAVVLMDHDGSVNRYHGIGDAAPGNVNRMIANHLIRMAETRAKARALRDAINVGATAFEELGGEDEASTPTNPTQGSQTGTERAQTGSGEQGANVSNLRGAAKQATAAKNGSDGDEGITANQRGQLTTIAKVLWDTDDAGEAKREMNAWVKQHFGVEVSELKSREAEKLITGLQKRIEEREKEQGQDDTSEGEPEVEITEDDFEDIPV